MKSKGETKDGASLKQEMGMSVEVLSESRSII